MSCLFYCYVLLKMVFPLIVLLYCYILMKMVFPPVVIQQDIDCVTVILNCTRFFLTDSNSIHSGAKFSHPPFNNMFFIWTWRCFLFVCLFFLTKNRDSLHHKREEVKKVSGYLKKCQYDCCIVYSFLLNRNTTLKHCGFTDTFW